MVPRSTRSSRPKGPGPGERGWLENMADRMKKGKGLFTDTSQEEKASQEQKQKKAAVQCTGCGFEEPPQAKRKRDTDVFNWLLCDICHLWWHDTCGGSTAAEYKDRDWSCPPCYCKMPGLVNSPASEDSSDEDIEPGATPCRRNKKKTKQRKRRPTAADFFTDKSSSPPLTPHHQTV